MDDILRAITYVKEPEEVEDLAFSIGLGHLLHSQLTIKDFQLQVGRMIGKYEQQEEPTLQKRFKESGSYSVYRLLNELVEDSAMISMNPDLVGNYNKISHIRSEESSPNEEWLKITKVVGNVRRANLSLSCYHKIKVTIPENDKGIEAGERELDRLYTFTFVRDGVLNQRCIAVTVSPKLQEKLKEAGVVGDSIISDCTYIIDLQKLPIISKHELLKPDWYEIGRLHSDIQRMTDSINILSIKNKQSLSTTDNFLKNLYKSSKKEKGTKPYTYKELDVRVMRRDCTSFKTELYLYASGRPERHSGHRKFILEVINSEKTIEEYKEEKEKLTKQLRDIMFRVLCSGEINIASNPYISKELEYIVTWKIKEKTILI